MKKALLLVGSLAHSGKWRAVLAPSMDQLLLEAMITVLGLLGGVSKAWRFDRMSTAYSVSGGDAKTEFATFAMHYGVQVAVCPPRSGHCKGAAQRWWRTLPHETTSEQAQGSVLRFATSQDARERRTAVGKTTCEALAATEHLAALAAPYPVILTEVRVSSGQSLIPWRGNHYSVPPELAPAQVIVSHRLGTTHLDIAVKDGTVIARHRRAVNGLGATIRDTGHVVTLNQAAKAGANTARRHRRKERIPPGIEALTAAAVLREGPKNSLGSATNPLAACERAVLPGLLDEATASGRSTTETLARIMSVGIDQAESRKLAGSLCFANLPTVARLDTFDSDRAKGIDRSLLNEVGTCRWIETATNVLLIGPPGVGKTHLAAGWGGPPRMLDIASISPPARPSWPRAAQGRHRTAMVIDHALLRRPCAVDH